LLRVPGCTTARAAYQATVIGKGQTGRRPLLPLLQCEIGHIRTAAIVGLARYPSCSRHGLKSPSEARRTPMLSIDFACVSIKFRKSLSRLIAATNGGFAELTGRMGPV
jgi:hypothetical protein